MSNAYLFQRHTVLNEQRNSRIEVAYVFLEYEVLLRLRRDLGLQLSQYLLGWSLSIGVHISMQRACTFGQIVFNLEFLVFGRHGQIQGRDRVPLRLAHRSRAVVG